MSLSPGTRLGPYEIVAPIGAGGMGEVYRARDPRLNRDVAIKVLPASFSEDADRLRRFEHEAKAAGVLNHPNVTAVYDIGTDADGAPYVVQELLEGETLRAALASGKLSARRTVDYAIGIARGLAAAHEKGIVHRDLKPENLFVTQDGNIKILDFGLAKLTETAGAEGQTNLPTAAPATEPGVVLGTLGYMSPEQVRGKPADHRSDIFSFGAILYEMLSGNRAFRGDSAADTMSAILKEDPPELSVSGQSISPALERIVRHCLEKTPERRLHSAHDLAFELEALTQTSGTAAALPSRRTYGRVWAALAIAAAAAAIVAAFALGRRGGPARNGGITRSFTQLTSFTGSESSPGLSPDGQTMAFVRRSGGSNKIWTLRTGGQNPTNLTPDCDRDSGSPAFSPDGKVVAYSTTCDGGGILLVGATGENARRLTRNGDSPAWSPDGREIVYDTEIGWTPAGRFTTSELWIADVASGKTRKIFDGDAVQPDVSPHGLRIAYWGIPADGSQRDIWTVPYPSGPYPSGGPAGKPVAVTHDAALDWNPVWSSDGRFLYFLSDRDGSMNLWRVPIDEKTGAPQGPPEPRTLPSREVAGFAIARGGGQLAYVVNEWEYSIERLTLDPAGAVRGGPIEVLKSTRSFSFASETPDGTQMTFDSQGSVREDIFIARSDGTRSRRLTDDAPRDRAPFFFPDGKRIAFQSDRGSGWDIWSIATDGSDLKQLTKGTNAFTPIVSPDGRRIAASDGTTAWIFELNDAGNLARSQKVPPPPGGDIATATDFTGDGRGLLVILNRKDSTFAGVALFDLDAGQWKALPSVPTTGLPTEFVTFAGPHRLVTNTREGIVTIELSSGAQHLLLPHPQDGAYVAFTTNRAGTMMLLTRQHQNADIWMSTPP
jgi:eukaryotic-like serine/threonine-protein kinase